MDEDLDSLVERIAARAGTQLTADVLDVGADAGPVESDTGEPLFSSARLFRVDSVEVLLVSVPSSFEAYTRCRWRSGQPDFGAEISRQVWAVANKLPKRTLGRIALVRLEEGWTKPDFVANAVELSDRAIMKYVIPNPEGFQATLDRIPVLADLWAVSETVRASWLARLSAPGRLGPLSKADVEVAEGPGVIVLHGGNATGKTTLVTHAGAALHGRDTPLSLEFSTGRPRPETVGIHLLRAPQVEDLEDRAQDMAMRPFRRLMGYGDRDGVLKSPIALFESASTLRMERLGRMLLANATMSLQDGDWPGLLLDDVVSGLDTVRGCKLQEVIVRLAKHRQIVVTARGMDAESTWRRLAEFNAVPCACVTLQLGEAVFDRRKTENVQAAEPIESSVPTP